MWLAVKEILVPTEELIYEFCTNSKSERKAAQASGC